MIGIKLLNHKEETKNKIVDYLEPKYVYFKIDDNNELLIKEKDKVLMGDKIIKTKFGSFIHSSVSGKFVGIEEKLDYKNNKSKFIKIENDFKETNKFEKPAITNKEDFINLLKENGIVGLGGAGFPTFIKYDTDKAKTLIINGVECEPYITSDYITMFNHMKDIVKTLDFIQKIYNLEEVFIAIKGYNRNLKEKIITMIRKYPKIHVIEVPNLYPMGWEKSLVRYIKHVDYDSLPIEKNIIVSNASTIYSISEALNGKPLIEKVVTISGNAIKNPLNIKLKIGTEFSELISKFNGYKEEDLILITGGPMMGESISSDNFIISNNLNSVIGLKNYKEKETINCLRCGKCIDNCPQKLCPVLVKDNIDNKEELKRLNVNKCIECGICSFVCPSRINLREYLRDAKKKVK